MMDPATHEMAKNFFSQPLPVLWMGPGKITSGKFLQQVYFNQTGNFSLDKPFYADAEAVLQRVGQQRTVRLSEPEEVTLKLFYTALHLLRMQENSQADSDVGRALDPTGFVKMIENSQRERVPSLDEAAQDARSNHTICVENIELLDKLIDQFKRIGKKSGLNFGIGR